MRFQFKPFFLFSNGVRSILLNSSWLFLEQSLRLFLGLGITILAARVFSAEQFGIWSYSLAIVGMLGAIATFGINSVLVREVITNTNFKSQLIASSVVLRILTAAFSYFVILVIALISEGQTKTLLLILGLVLILQTTEIIDYIFQAKLALKKPAIIRMIAFLASSICKLFFLLIYPSLTFFALAHVLEFTMTTLGYLFLENFRLRGVLQFESKIFRSLFKESFPIFFSNMMTATYMKVDQILVGLILGKEFVAYYSVTVLLSEVWYLIPAILITAIYPTLLKKKQQNSDIFKINNLKTYAAFFWIGMIISTLVSIFSEQVIGLLFGNKYEISIYVLQIHIWALPFMFLAIAINSYLMIHKMHRCLAIRSSVAAITNVIFNLLLTPKYGLAGTAFSTIIAYATLVFSIFLFPSLHAHSKQMIRALMFKFNES